MTASQHREADPDDLAAAEVGLADVGHDPPHLQADEQEHRVLQQELDRRPVHALGSAARGVLQHR